jgi:hypothetical protein
MNLLPFTLKPERLEVKMRGWPRLFDRETQAGVDQLPERRTARGGVLAGRAKEWIGNLDSGLCHANRLSDALRDII